MQNETECPECNGFGLIAVVGVPRAWTRANADDPAGARPRKRCGRCGATAQGRPVPVPLVLRGRLIVEDQWGDEADAEASCATCRWAVMQFRGVGKRRKEDGLECQRWKADDGLCVPSTDYGDGESRLAVQPDFGCVQWEAK